MKKLILILLLSAFSINAQINLDGMRQVPSLWKLNNSIINLSNSGWSLGSITFTGKITADSVHVSGGTATNPSMSFSQNKDLGFYRRGANQIGITTGNNNSWYIDNAYIGSASGNRGSLYSGAGDASSTQPTILPRRAATNLGVGALDNSTLSLIANGVGIAHLNGGNLYVGTIDFDGTPAIGRLVVKGSGNTSATNAQVWRDSDENNIAWIDNDGGLTTTSYKLSALQTPPASATATGTAGTIIYGTDGYLYVCTATNTWVRVQLETWE